MGVLDGSEKSGSHRLTGWTRMGWRRGLVEWSVAQSDEKVQLGSVSHTRCTRNSPHPQVLILFSHVELKGSPSNRPLSTGQVPVVAALIIIATAGPGVRQN